MKIDLKDRKILYHLSLNSRQGNKEIAKKIGLSEQVTGYRIKKLIEKRIIKYFYIRTNPAKQGYIHYKIFLKTKNMNADTEQKFVESLKSNKNIIWVVSVRGDFDYIISILAQDIHEFSRVYKQINDSYGKHVLHRQVSIVEKAYTFSRDYLLNNISQEFRYGGKEELIKLNKEDTRILKAIAINARMPATDLARQLQTSAEKIIYHIKKLKENSFITGFAMSLNLKLLEIKQYLIALKMQDMNEEKFNKLKEIVKKNRSIQYFILVVGDHDIDLELEIQNNEQLDQLFKELKKEFIYELIDYTLLEITEEHKLNYFPF